MQIAAQQFTNIFCVIVNVAPLRVRVSARVCVCGSQVDSQVFAFARSGTKELTLITL